MPPSREGFFNQWTTFPLMNYDALNEALGGSIETTWNPWGSCKTVSTLFLDATVMFSTSGVFSSGAVHIRSRRYSH
jgi:hypothetical protein